MNKPAIPAFLLVLTSLLALIRCANPVTPEGGPKDVTPPSVTQCEPRDSSVHFTGKTIRLTFDEFVNVDATGGKILVSPPLREQPDFRLRGKTLIISFADTLRPNTTYTIDFAKSVTDITENNPLQNFVYALSTGAWLDTLSIAGRVLDAFNLQPVANIYVMVYLNNNDTVPFDSLPMKVKPEAVTRTNDQGEFLLSCLPDGAYRLIALQDVDENLLFNMKGEKIAFADSLVHPWYTRHPLPDTLKKDSSLALPVAIPGALELRLFEEMDSTQMLVRSDLVKDKEVRLIFKYPVTAPVIHPVNRDSTADWCFREINPTRDTLTFWLKPGLADTLILAVSDHYMKPDTITLDLHPKFSGKRQKKAEALKPPPLDVSINTMGGTLNYFKTPLVLRFGYPLARYDFSRVLLVEQKDTLHPTLRITDSLQSKATVSFKWSEGKTYHLFIPDSVFTSYNGLSNDTLRFTLRTPNLRDFGSLTLDLTFDQGPGKYLVQLLAEKDRVIEQQTLISPGKVIFNYLSPGKFRVKAIRDRNDNGRWDAGNYIWMIQPEMVYYFPKTIEVRANWDVEEPWNLGSTQ